MATNPESNRGGAVSRFVTNCTSPDGSPTSVEISVCKDDGIEISIHPGSIGRVTPEQAAAVRAQLDRGRADRCPVEGAGPAQVQQLAAVRLRALTVDEILARLEDRFRLLTRVTVALRPAIRRCEPQ
jgi:hypothetical protein